MEVKMNTTDRKGLVKAIAEIIGTAAAYKGAPTFAYEIGEYPMDAIQHLYLQMERMSTICCKA